MITIILSNDYYALSLLVFVRGRTSISIGFCPPLFLHKMYTLLLLYEMLMCAGNKLNTLVITTATCENWKSHVRISRQIHKTIENNVFGSFYTNRVCCVHVLFSPF